MKLFAHIRPTFSAFFAVAVCAISVSAQPHLPSAALVAMSEQPKLLDTLKSLVNIETGSTHRDGLDTCAEFIAARLKTLGGSVEIIEAAPEDIYKLEGLPDRIGQIGRAHV